ncbi:MAG: glycosyltransferase family 2 protein [Mesorhizobium sp.]|nr:glycosyltransferase family 2 protein [Mesorhizobium sp.]
MNGAAELMSARDRVTLVTVSYNSAPVLAELLGSVPAGVPVVVVDNGGSDATAEVASGHGARLLRLERNQGFGRGCNAGAALAETEFLFFVNPDARLDPGCVEALVAFADAHPEASSANPRILDDRGRTRFRGRSALSDPGEWVTGGIPSEATPVPTLLGGALFCRRSAFGAVSGFDPNIFLYHEDDDLAVRLRRQAGPAYFVPEAAVRHSGGRSSGRSTEVARFKGYHMARSRAYVFAKYGKSLPWARTLGRALFEMILPHNLLSSRRRAKHLGQVAGAWSARSDGGKFGDA